MLQCVGYDNKIIREGLFMRVYLREYNHDFFSDRKDWKRIIDAMRYLRKNSNCFIVSHQEGRYFYYYVPTKKKEIQQYVARCENMMRAYGFNAIRCKVNLKQKNYKKEWTV